MVTEVKAMSQSQFEQSLRGMFKQIKPPAYTTGLKDVAAARFETMAFPTRHQEAYKYVNLTPILNTAFKRFENVTPDEALIKARIYPECQNSVLVFFNGVYQPDYSNTSALPEVVVLSALSSLSSSPYDEATMAVRLQATPNIFTVANTMLFEDGVALSIPKNTEVQHPIQLLFIAAHPSMPPGMTAPKLVIQLGEHAKATVIERYVGQSDNACYLSLVDSHTQLGDGAQLTSLIIQEDDQGGMQLQDRLARLGRDAVYKQTTFALHGFLSRFETRVAIEGEQAHAEVNGLLMIDADRQSHHHVVVHHKAPHGTSNQLYKSIAADTSRGEFDGSIVIDKPAQKTHAEQLNKNLLLSSDAKVYTRPQLQIDADDVQCAHGATVGQLDEEELFYLTSRGISSHQARRILLYGFAKELLDTVPAATLPSVRSQLEATLDARLTALPAVQ